ncbi:cell wall hydrolase [Heyndrickxia camelliae]|uniref:Spore cortex-lytic protein n=1 Tax=Heyndrickxia camelliae TaxID=1707093 RepID=A0A2N3LPF9_9BACI|nr:cell wall hydrolase [Heyndrickxia camelliae]PKR86562.1 spore cortex-lytic protein [Heyndrickxia camelliae]
MKNIYMKVVVVACVATTTLIGIQNRTAEAFTGEHSVKIENLLIKEKQETKIQQAGFDIQKLSMTHDKIQDKVIKQEKEKRKQDKGKKEKMKEEYSIKISSKEKDLLARLVQAEAKGEPFKGKVAVATVVLNRLKSPEFPDTITGVIQQKVGDCYAFSPVQNGQIKKPASKDAKKAAEVALKSKDRLHDSVYFYNPEIATDTWIRSRDVVTTIGNHVFAK